MAGWLVAGLSALGLLNFSRAGHQAKVPLTAALDSGLGTRRRTDSAGLWRQPAGSGTAKTPGLLRMMRIYRDYAHDADISYGEYGRANHLDIWRRPDLDPTGKAPVLFQIPGGAWTTGNKRGQAHPLMSHLAELGWICVAINYRHSPRNTWPDHIVDVKRALAWVKAHIADYGGDPRLHCHHRRFGRRPLVVAGGADAQRPAVPAGVRRRRHPGAGRRVVLRRL